MTAATRASAPSLWRRGVKPVDLRDGNVTLVPNGASACGTCTDALIQLDEAEVARRASFASKAVTSLPVLDAMLNLPLGVAIDEANLAERQRQLVLKAPRSAVDMCDGRVVRRLTAPAMVVAALVWAAPAHDRPLSHTAWRSALRSACAFGSFAQRVVVVPAVPASSVLWEADLAGVGVWLRRETQALTELVPPAPFHPAYYKAAGWAFAERAFRAWSNGRDDHE